VSAAASGKGRKAQMTDSKPPSDSEERQDEKWYDRTRYQVLLFVGGIVLFVLVGGWILHLYIEPHTSGQKKDLVQALGLLTAGVAGAVGIFFTWRGQRITQESLQDTRENSEENLRLAREGQITERFTRAIDQLGATAAADNKKLEVRLGGIYALERIDKESPERVYHSTVMEVLTAYIREDSRRDHSGESSRRRPPADIQAILTVLSRRQLGGAPKDGMAYLVLRGANLEGTELQSANLEGTNLEGTNLQGARLAGTNLQHAQLQDAQLQEANLRGAYLRGARLQGADLQEADLRGADLRDARVTDEQLADTRFLQGATMPNGQKYEDWIKDKEDSGKDVENE
jgi:hypothetical protein